jgi:hypothetical protein
MRRLAASLVLLALALASLGTDCSKSRPMECQKLRQCCAVAQGTGAEVEGIRVACTRQDDDQAAICLRRLDEVKAAVPSIAYDPACRVGE